MLLPFGPAEAQEPSVTPTKLFIAPIADRNLGHGPTVYEYIERMMGAPEFRSEIRHEHLAELRRLYRFRFFSGDARRAARELGDRLREEVEQARSKRGPGPQVRRRLPTHTSHPAGHDGDRTALRRPAGRGGAPDRSAHRPPGLRRDLEHLLEETADAGVTRFVWLRQFEPGGNSADANRLLDRLEHLRRLDVPEGLFHEIPPHRITRLRRLGERYFADGLRELELSSNGIRSMSRRLWMSYPGTIRRMRSSYS